MKEIRLKKCETDVRYIEDGYFGNVIGFKQRYEDAESNLYDLYFSAILEDTELEINLEEDNRECVADCDFIISWHDCENEWDFNSHNAHYSISGRPSIRKGSLRIYLDAVIKIT